MKHQNYEETGEFMDFPFANLEKKFKKSHLLITHGAGKAGNMRMWRDSVTQLSWIRSGSMGIS